MDEKNQLFVYFNEPFIAKKILRKGQSVKCQDIVLINWNTINLLFDEAA